jgi:hypothetical protein
MELLLLDRRGEAEMDEESLLPVIDCGSVAVPERRAELPAALPVGGLDIVLAEEPLGDDVVGLGDPTRLDDLPGVAYILRAADRRAERRVDGDTAALEDERREKKGKQKREESFHGSSTVIMVEMLAGISLMTRTTGVVTARRGEA